ncbi:MAG TPA: YdeI/OmpD-associated family protein [Spirochaetia bacterium]|nr:YdeI/OmpD-associated family protein [Spirochaetia bacterium]
MKDILVVAFESASAWETWLEKNHARSAGLWMKIAKRSKAASSVSYAEALEVALCYGWIDGQKDKLDETWWLQKFTPRGAKSIWSRTNREKAIALEKDGRMKPAGLAAMESAKADGRWLAAYDSQKTAAVPSDLQNELDKEPQARAFFSTLNSRNRYAILFRIQNARRPETRNRRLRQFVEMLKKGKTIYPQAQG